MSKFIEIIIEGEPVLINPEEITSFDGENLELHGKSYYTLDKNEGRKLWKILEATK